MCIPMPISKDKILFLIAEEYKEDFCYWGKFSLKSCLQGMNQFPTRWDLGTEEVVVFRGEEGLNDEQHEWNSQSLNRCHFHLFIYLFLLVPIISCLFYFSQFHYSFARTMVYFSSNFGGILDSIPSFLYPCQICRHFYILVKRIKQVNSNIKSFQRPLLFFKLGALNKGNFET